MTTASAPRTTTRTTTRTSVRGLATVTALTAAALLAGAGTATAHVSVNPDQAEQGGYTTVDFKVPNERDDASTVEIEVNLPADHPLTSVMPQPVPGWDVKVTKSKLDKPVESHGTQIDEAATKITWSGGEIEPGQFQQFPVSMGQLPEDVDRLAFKTLQTYDSGEVVRWIEVPAKGGDEPEHPAPVLALAAAEGGGHGDAKPGDPSAAETGDGNETSAAADGADTTARVLAVVGILVGLAGVAFGVLAGRRRNA